MAGGQARLQIVIDAFNNAGDELKGIKQDLGDVGKEAKSAGSSLKDFGGSADGAVTKLLRMEAASAVMADAKAKVAGMSDAEKVATLSAADLADAQAKAAKAAKDSNEEFRVFGLSLTDMKSGVDLAMGGLEKLKQVWDFAKEGAENQRIAKSFDDTAKSVGVSAEEMSAALDKAARGTVDDEASMQIATRNMALGMATDLKSNVQLMELARSASVKFGGDTETAFEGISTAIGNLQTRQLKQYGIIVDTKEANETYAKAIGKTADQLTEAEQRTALLNDVMDKSKVVFKDAGDAADTTSEKMKRVEIAAGNLLDVLKEIAATGIGTGLDLLEGPGKVMAAFTGTAEKMRVEVFAGRMTLKDYQDGLAGMAQAMREAGLVIPVATYNTYQLNEAQVAATQGAYGLAGGLDESNRAALRASESSKGLADENKKTADAIKQGVSNITRNYEAMGKAAEQRAKDDIASMKLLELTMGGAVSGEMSSYLSKEEELQASASKLRDEIEKLTAANGSAIITKQTDTMTDNERAASQAKLAMVTEDLTNRTRKKNETDLEFESRMAGLQVQADGLTGKLEGNAAAVTHYVDNSKKIGELQGEYDAITAKIDENAQAHETATKKILFGFAQQQLAADGLSSVEVAALNALAKDFGLIDDKTATAFEKTMAATQQLAQDKNIDTFKTNMSGVYDEVSGKADTYNASTEGARKKLEEMGIFVLSNTTPALNTLTDKSVVPTTKAVETQTIKVDLLTGAWGKIPTNVKTTYTIVTKGEIPSGGTSEAKGSYPPSRAMGGPTGQGGLFMLHPNEFVLSEAMRDGRAPIPAGAVTASGITGSKTTIVNLYDTLAAKMYLEQQRVDDLRRIGEMM